MPSPQVYVIDDDGEALSSLNFLLNTLEFSCRCFPSAEQFMKVLDDLDPGCIITDLHMTGLSGLDLADVLSKRSIYWPIILATGRSDVTSTQDIMLSKKITLLLKPFSKNDLVEALERCKNYQRV